MDDFATAGEERSDAREIARVDICLHLRLDAGETAGIEALRFGSGDLCHWRMRRGHRGIVPRAPEEEAWVKERIYVVPLGKAIARHSAHRDRIVGNT
jgi:hypothetical protein